MNRKKDCRKFYKELRGSMPATEVQEKSAIISQKILESDAYKAAESILGYYHLGNEVDCCQILEQALSDGKKVALPKTEKGSRMHFYVVKNLTKDTEKGAFGIMEPKVTCEIFNPKLENSVLAFVPGVVFDRNGNRYGYGRGYYDGYLADFPEVSRVALAYQLQISETILETLVTDIKMHAIVTEQETIIMK